MGLGSLGSTSSKEAWPEDGSPQRRSTHNYYVYPTAGSMVIYTCMSLKTITLQPPALL